MLDLKLEQTDDLINELIRRSHGGLIALIPPSSDGKWITAFDKKNILATLGLLKVIKTRIDIHTEDFFYIDEEDDDDEIYQD